MSRIVKSLAAVVAASLLLLMAPESGAFARTALPMEGKHSLYQRIITKPHADIVDAATTGARTVVHDLAPFSIYYVYGRSNGFVEVGANVSGNAKGWIAEDHTVDWKQSIAVAFNNRAEAGRQRQLFFADRAHLDDALHGETFFDRLADLRRGAIAGESDGTVVAVEPENFVNVDQSFYLFPILSHERADLPFGLRGNYLEVASITNRPAPPSNTEFRAGISFVLDTTRSMQPYIDGTKAAIRKVQAKLSQSDVGDAMRFGLVGFRQDPATNAALEYQVRTFLPVAEGSTAEKFVSTISGVTATSVSTPSFNEDSVGGVFEAIQSSDWSRYAAGIVVLITDASPHLPSEGHTFAGDIGVQQIAGLAERKGIRLFVVHLRTPQGEADHDNAEAAYRTMTLREGASNYIGIENGDFGNFSDEVDGLAMNLINLVKSTRDGSTYTPTGDTQAARLMARVGLAMQLEYVGARRGEAAPDFYRAWTTDVAPEDPRRQALDVRILLTRNQLSSLAGALRPIVDEADSPSARTDPMAFFRRVQELAARANNDTRQISSGTPLGALLGEYLDDLPYRSPILGLTAEDWVLQNRAQQTDILAALKSKLGYYERIHNQPERWVRLDPDAADGEQVTLIPLIQMP